MSNPDTQFFVSCHLNAAALIHFHVYDTNFISNNSIMSLISSFVKELKAITLLNRSAMLIDRFL